MAWNLRFHSPSEIKNGEHVAQFPLIVQMGREKDLGNLRNLDNFQTIDQFKRKLITYEEDLMF